MSTMTTPRPGTAGIRAGRQGQGDTRLRAPSVDPLRVLRRHLWAIFASMIVGVVVGIAAFVIFDLTLPYYSGEVLFEVRPGLEKPDSVGTMDRGADTTVERLARTEIQLMLSEIVLMKAVSTRDVRDTVWAKQFKDSAGNVEVLKAVDELMDEVSDVIVRNSNLFGIKWSTSNPSDVPIVLNRIKDSYLEKRRAIDNEVYESNEKTFEDQLRNTTADIEDLNEQMEQFIRDKGITALDDPRFHQSSLAINGLVVQIAEVQQSISMLESVRLQTQAKLMGNVEPTSEDLLMADQHPAIAALDGRLLSYRTDLRHLRTKYPNGHHSIDELEDRIVATEQERESKKHEVIKSVLAGRVKEVSNTRENYIDMLDKLEVDYERTDAELRELAASYSVYRNLHDRRALLEAKRDSDIGLIKDLQLLKAREDASRVRLWLEPVKPREKSFPKMELIIPLFGILTVALTVGVIFLREITDQRIKQASDLAVIPGADVLGVVPDLGEDPTKSTAAELVVRKHPNSVLAESYRQTSTPILKRMDRRQHQSLLVIGGLPGAGSTTLTTNLAATASAAGRRVVAIDANFRRPRLAKAMGASTDAPGLGDFLADQASVDQICQKCEYGVDVISSGTAANRVFERLANGMFDSLMAQLRDTYDLILIDVPPAVVAGDAIALASRTDAAVLIVKANQEHRGLVARLINQLADTQSELLGIVLNRARGTAGGYFRKNFATMAEYASKSG